MSFLTIDPVVVSFGGLSIRWYALIILSGAMLATVLSNREALKKNLPKDFIYDLLFYLLPLGIIGARIYYVAFKWEDFAHDWLSVFAIWNGGIAIYGGLIAGLLVIHFYSKHFKVPTLLTLDIIVPTVLLAQAIGRWGNFVNQEAFGAVVSRQFLEGLFLPNWLIEQMFIDGSYRQPTFLYESLASLLGVLVIYAIRHKVRTLKLGDTTALYVLWYGIERFFIEGMRTDSLWIGPLRVSQALSLVLVVGAIAYLVYNRKTQTTLYQDYQYQKG